MPEASTEEPAAAKESAQASAPADEAPSASEAVTSAETPSASAETASAVADVAEPLAVGKSVEVIGTQMNGSVGVLEEFLSAKERWKVKFASGVSKNFKAESLRVIKEKKKKATKAKADDREAYTKIVDLPKGGACEIAARANSSSLSDALSFFRRDVGTQLLEAQTAVAEKKEVKETRGTASEVVRTETSHPAASSDAKVVREEAATSNEVVPELAAAAVVESVNLAGRTFKSPNELRDHLKAIQAKLESSEGDGSGVLKGEDAFLFFHMAMQHPLYSAQLHAPVKGFRYGNHSRFPSAKCFIVMLGDGTEEPVSANRCCRELFGMTDKRKNAADNQGGNQKRRKTEPAAPVAEKTRHEIGLKLLKEEAAAQGHADASRWEYPLMDETRRCFAGYLRSSLEADVLKKLYATVEKGTNWREPVDPRSGEPIPRKTSWMVQSGLGSCTYRYGGVDVEAEEFPAWMNEVMSTFMPLCGLPTRETWPNSCNLNLYEDGSMSVGWHSDDEKLFNGRFADIRIISLTLGHSRTFELRERADGLEDASEARTKYKMKLSDGDLCTMEGLTQKYYQHRVPKEEASGPRINLTWRWVVKHKGESSVAK